MPRFFLPSDRFANGDIVTIDGDDARHISRSLRMSVGDEIILCDMRGNEYKCVLTAFSGESVLANVITSKHSSSEPPYKITLYQGIPKGDKLETIIQKAVECGACEIVPVECERCIAKINADTAERKIQRWQKISDEAAKQSQRGSLVKVRNPVSFDEACAEMSQDEFAFVCYEGDGTLPLSKLMPEKTPRSVSFIIGPEGGLAPCEVEKAMEMNISLAGLGKRILRTETASGFVLAVLCAKYEM